MSNADRSSLSLFPSILYLFSISISISTIIKIEDVFTGTLVHHLCMSRFLSSLNFENTYPYLSRFLNSFAFGNIEGVV